MWVDPLGLSCKEGWGKKYTDTLGDMAKQTAAEQKELHGQTSGWGNVMQGIYKPIESLGRGIGNTVGLLEAMGPNGISPQVKGYWAGVGQGIKDLGGLAYGAATGDPKAWAQLTPAVVGGAVLRKMPGKLPNKKNNFDYDSPSSVKFEDFNKTVDDFNNNPNLAKKSFDLFKEEKWSELEDLFKKENVNGGWPPNRGAISVNKIDLEPGQKIDRYGGFIDKDSGEFKDFGSFMAKANEPFENRALPSDTLNKPYKQYEVVKKIPEVKASKAIPWFGQKGKGMQYETPLSTNELLEHGYIKEIN